MLNGVGAILTPDTILRWQRELVTQKWDYSDQWKKKPERLPVSDEVKQFIVRCAKENPDWEFDRILNRLSDSR